MGSGLSCMDSKGQVQETPRPRPTVEHVEVHVPEEQGVDISSLYKLADQKVDDVIANKRIGFTYFRTQVAKAAGAEQQLTAATACTVIYSAEVDDFRSWVDVAPTNSCSITTCMSPSNINFGCTMLKLLFDVANDMAEAARTTPGNQPISEEQLVRVLVLKSVWSRLMAAAAAINIKHPSLGRICLMQPLLHNCLVYRTTNGNRDGEIPDPVFEYLMQQGADPNSRNCLGLPCLIVLAGVLKTYMENSKPESYTLSAVKAITNTARILLRYGADPNLKVLPFSASGLSLDMSTGAIMALGPLLTGPKPFTVFDCLDAWQPGAGTPEWEQLAAEFRLVLQQGVPRDQVILAPYQRAWQQRPLQVPWTHAMYNIMWAASQVTMATEPKARLRVLDSICASAPFILPTMSVISVPQLRSLDHIPRYSLVPQQSSSGAGGGGSSSSFQPIPATELPPNAVTVFLSHRWLGNGCPDDERKTKLQQVFQVAKALSKERGIPEDLVYFWIDYSVVDQSCPMPGVQALPVYIACCDAFVYVYHEQYYERAWCLTEQYMFWKLCKGQTKYCLKNGQLMVEDGHHKPPDPAQGKLAVEADRLALATMSAMLPYRDEMLWG